MKRKLTAKASLVLATSVTAIVLVTACAQADSGAKVNVENKVVAVNAAASDDSTVAKKSYGPPMEFRGTISGDVLDMSANEGEVETDQVKQFMATGENPYKGDKAAIEKGYTIYSTACSGCHGHLGEGKLGPALADDYWTYPKNETDKGLFETIWGGANGMMGPQKGLIAKDEILHIISWLRHIEEENAKNPDAAAH